MTTDAGETPLPPEPRHEGAIIHPHGEAVANGSRPDDHAADDQDDNADDTRLQREASISSEGLLPLSSTNVDFDPSALVEVGSDPAPFEAIEAKALREVIPISGRGGSADEICNLTSLDDGAISVESGKFTFTVHRDLFGRAITDICEAAQLSSRGISQFYPVRLCLSSRDIKLTWLGPEVFFATAVAATSSIHGIDPDGKIACQLDLRQLRKLSRARASQESLTVVYNPKIAQLIIHSEVASKSPVRLRLAAHPAAALGPKVQCTFGPIAHLQLVDPVVIRQAVRFASLFSERSEVRPHVGIGDGEAYAYGQNRLGLLTSTKLNVPRFGIRYQHGDLVARLLASFDASTTHLFDADKHHFLYDGATCLGFQKAPPGLSSLPPQLTGKHRSRMVIDRGTLRSALGWLGAVSPYSLDGKFLVTLRVEGRGPHARMSLQTWDEAKKSRGVSTIECTRTVDEATSYALPTYRISLPLQTLRDVVAHFDSANVVLEELDGGPLRIQDGGKQFQATSWIAGVTEEKLAPPGRYIGGRQNRQASPSLYR